MFLTAPVVWLQAWATPALTRTMEVISWFGYTRTAMALGIFVTFALRLRAGMALLLLLGLNSLATDLAKTSAALPRPFAVDRDVRILGWPAPAPRRWGTAATRWWDTPRVTPPPSAAIASGIANATDSETGYGFPSGHVSTTTTFVIGLIALLGGRWLRVAGVAWLSLMALSRLYLGRHFIGDVLGGLAVGSIVVGFGLTVLRLRALTSSPLTRESARAAQINALVAAALLGAALTVGRPDVGDTGRLAGIAAAALALTHLGMVDLPRGLLARAGLVTIAGLGYGLVWAVLTFGLPPQRVAATARRLATSALPAFAMLALPAAISGRHRSGAPERT